ncbi:MULTISPECIES: ABC transporter substrate-binding protein [Halomonadaceae]|uniref:ABC transporter substrate-binding protein n=1 Tax=Halomonadaceae TaxID=28256 RepID=UPI001599976D|nr:MULTISPECIES: ABC transporter substrate-binding protein [Halomonas]QJQ95538.1 ABC transporter substrate-binding protein [Halomonas sp. PA5]
MKRGYIKLLVAISASTVLSGPLMASEETVLRIGMTVSGIPQTTGQANQGGEGHRFVALQLYDALVAWDLRHSDEPAELVPGLAKSWEVDPDDPTRWLFTLREGVEFHDGSVFNADSVIWNFDKIFKEDAPQYDARQASQVLNRIPGVDSYEKIGEYKIAITTPYPDSQLPYQLTWFMISSPAHFSEVGNDWDAFAEQPSGTGPWTLDNIVSRQRVEMIRNENYWDKERIPQTDRLILVPMPEPTTRTAALLSGQVDWIEAPSPDSIPRLESAGMQIVTNIYPHVWPWTFSHIEGSPWNDINVRKAANLAIDREGLVEMLGGMAAPSYGQVPREHPWYGNPNFDIRYDPDEARRLLAESGYSQSNPVNVTVLISPSGSGQMQPLPMNEYIQANLSEVGINVDYQVVEWTALRNVSRVGAQAPESRGIHAFNHSYGTSSPFEAYTRFFHSAMVPPHGRNWGYTINNEIDELLDEVLVTFDPDEQAQLLARVNEILVDDAHWLWVVHDVSPRALSPRVSGFIPPQSWYIDLTNVVVK